MRLAAIAALLCLVPSVAFAAEDLARPTEGVVRPSVWTGQTRTFANGTKLATKGSEVMVTTAGGQKVIIQRSDPDFASSQPPPLNAKPMSCSSWMQTIMLSPLTDRAWRRAVANYSNYCL